MAYTKEEREFVAQRCVQQHTPITVREQQAVQSRMDAVLPAIQHELKAYVRCIRDCVEDLINLMATLADGLEKYVDDLYEEEEN